MSHSKARSGGANRSGPHPPKDTSRHRSESDINSEVSELEKFRFSINFLSFVFIGGICFCVLVHGITLKKIHKASTASQNRYSEIYPIKKTIKCHLKLKFSS